jgi:hypothetical protein
VAGVDVDVEEAGVRMAVVEDVETDVGVEAGSDAMLMLSSFSLCSDLIGFRNDRNRCRLVFCVTEERLRLVKILCSAPQLIPQIPSAELFL